jgi:predicted N-acetyltransferase YhbS
VNKKDFTIRSTEERDFNAIQSVTLSASQEFNESMSPPLWEAYLQNLLEALDDDMQVERIVAVQNGVIVGSVSLYPPMANAYSGISTGYAWPEVRLLAVLPEVRGQGIGTSLMNECKRRAYNAGGWTDVSVTYTKPRFDEAYASCFHRNTLISFFPPYSTLLKGTSDASNL